MELREIQTFLQVAQSKSFSKAAKELGYSQAAVTIQIRNLEQELGTRLFDRIGRQTVLTRQGTVFYDHAAAIMKTVEGAKAAVAESTEPTGTITIGVIESICATIFPNLIKEYHKRYPKVSVSIVLDSPSALIDRLEQNTLDLVYLLDQRIYDPKLVKIIELPEDIVFVASTDHPLAKRSSLSLDEIINEPFILTEKDASYRFTLDRHLASLGKSIQPSLEIGNTDFILNLIRTGSSLSFLPKYTVRQDVANGTIAILPIQDFHMHGWRQILYHKNKWITHEMAAFFELAQQS